MLQAKNNLNIFTRLMPEDLYYVIDRTDQSGWEDQGNKNIILFLSYCCLCLDLNIFVRNYDNPSIRSLMWLSNFKLWTRALRVKSQVSLYRVWEFLRPYFAIRFPSPGMASPSTRKDQGAASTAPGGRGRRGKKGWGLSWNWHTFERLSWRGC